MAAAAALIAMTAQCRREAADDGLEHLAMRPCQMHVGDQDLFNGQTNGLKEPDRQTGKNPDSGGKK
jgi:hypothetical protein